MAAQAGDYQTASAYLEPAIVVQRESIDTWRLRMESAEDDDEKERFRQNQLGAARHLEDLLTWKAMYDEGDADTIQAFLAPKIARTEQVVKDYFGKLLQ